MNDTAQALSCTSAELSDGAWGIAAPDTVGPGSSSQFRALSNVGSARGRVDYAIGGGTPGGEGTVSIGWSNPLVGSNVFSCDVHGVPGIRCVVSGTERGNHAAPTFVLQAA